MAIASVEDLFQLNLQPCSSGSAMPPFFRAASSLKLSESKQ
jgi:hypothetical protein